MSLGNKPLIILGIIAGGILLADKAFRKAKINETSD